MKEGGLIKNARSFIGLPVLLGPRVVGHVSDVSIDLSLKRLKGVYITGMPFGSRFIGLDDIEVIGEVSIIAKKAQTRSKPNEKPDIKALGADGVRIGRVTGALIDETSGSVEAVEVSKGFWEDIMEGRHWVFSYSAGTEFSDVIIKSEGVSDNE